MFCDVFVLAQVWIKICCVAHMDISDSFGSLDDPGPSLGPTSRPRNASIDSSVLDTFGTLDLPEARPAPSGADPHTTQRVQVVTPAQPAPTEPASNPRSRCGRKKGSTAQAIELRRLLANPDGTAALPAPSGPPRSRQEICRAAGKARQTKRKADTKPKKLFSGPSPAASSNSELALVQASMPWSEIRRDRQVALFRDTAAQQQLANWQPATIVRADAKTGVKVEAGIFQSGLSLMSKSQLAKKLGVSRKTVTSRLRLLAVCTFLVRKLRTEGRFLEAYQVLRLLHPELEVKKLLFIVKYKYDEMAMRCNTLVNGKLEKAVTKLLQVQLYWTALYQIGPEYVRYRAQLPTSVKTVESAKGGTFRRALESHVLFPECSNGFERKTRLPICDKHSTNTAVDYSFARDFEDEKLHKFNCLAHVEHRVADGVMIAYPNERKGLLHSGLAINFAGALSKIKASLKKANRANFTWYDSETGPGSEADAHRQAVFKHVCEVRAQDHREVSTGVQIMVYRRFHLWNGRYDRRGRTEHWCKSRDCCRDAEHCLQQMDDTIDDETGPGDWCPSRFMRIEETTDWELYWESNGGLLTIAIEDAWGDSVKAKPPDRGGIPAAHLVLLDGENLEEPEDDAAHDWHLPEDDLGLAEPLKDETQFERQSTFRSNTVLWLRSKPCGRLWCFKATIRVQQAAQRYLVMHAGPKWLAREMRRRLRGERPTYRVVNAAKGDFHKPAMHDWSYLMSNEGAWDGLPNHFRRHDLSIQSYRGLSAALGTKYELEVVVLETYPCKGYLILDESLLGAADCAAMEIQEDYEQNPCILCPQWFAHCHEFPTARELRQRKSLALAACRADEVELDNWGVEAHNANLYRTIKRSLQQKLAKVEDVNAGWMLRQDRLIHTYLWGDLEYPADAIRTTGPQSTDKKVMAGGGGGSCRAFVSLLAPDNVRPDGRTDFTAIMEKYKIEKAKESSEVLESLKELGVEATRARREQFEHGQRWLVSSFGKVRPQALRGDARRAELKRLMDAMPVSGSAESGDAGDGQLAIVPLVPRDPAAVGAMVAVAGSHLPDQLALLRRLARHQATRDRKAEEAIEKEVRDKLKTSKPLLGKHLPVSQSSSSDIRTLSTDMFFDLFFHDDICSDVMKKVAMVAKKDPVVVKACETLWKRDHEMVTDEGSPVLGTVPSSAKPTFCHLYGGGLCLCKGRGLLARIMAGNLCRAVCQRAPKDSELRKLLKGAWIVYRIGAIYCRSWDVQDVRSTFFSESFSSAQCPETLQGNYAWSVSGYWTDENLSENGSESYGGPNKDVIRARPYCALWRPAVRCGVVARGRPLFPASPPNIYRA